MANESTLILPKSTYSRLAKLQKTQKDRHINSNSLAAATGPAKNSNSYRNTISNNYNINESRQRVGSRDDPPSKGIGFGTAVSPVKLNNGRSEHVDQSARSLSRTHRARPILDAQNSGSPYQ